MARLHARRPSDRAISCAVEGRPSCATASRTRCRERVTRPPWLRRRSIQWDGRVWAQQVCESGSIDNASLRWEGNLSKRQPACNARLFADRSGGVFRSRPRDASWSSVDVRSGPWAEGRREMCEHLWRCKLGPAFPGESTVLRRNQHGRRARPGPAGRSRWGPGASPAGVPA